VARTTRSPVTSRGAGRRWGSGADRAPGRVLRHRRPHRHICLRHDHLLPRDLL